MTGTVVSSPSQWRLGSSRVLSWQAFWALVVFSLLFSVISNPTRIGLGLALPMAVSLTSLSMIFATLFLAQRTVLDPTRHPHRPLTVLAVYALASLARCVVNAWLLVLVGVIGPGALVERVVIAFLCFFAAIIVIDISLGAVDDHRRTMIELAAQESAARVERDAALARIESRRATARTVVHDEVDAILRDVDSGSPADLVTRLRTAIDDVVRPLSHEIRPSSNVAELSYSVDVPSPSWRAVLDDATYGRVVQPLLMALAMFVIGLAYVLSALPLGLAAVELAIATLGTWSVLTVAERVCRRWLLGDSVVARAITLTALLFVSGAVLAMLSVALLGRTDVATRLSLAYLLLIPILGWALALSQAADRQRQRLETAQRSRTRQMDWQATRARGASWEEKQQLAQILHGPVQGALGAAAIRLSLADQRGGVNSELRRQVRTDLTIALDALDHAGEPVNGLARLEREMQDVAATWQGSCEISWAFEGDAYVRLADDSVCARLASDIATEGCWNAIRHGGAGWVEITFAVANDPDGAIRVTVVDDGSSYDADAVPGLGTEMLDDVALRWTRERVNGATHLRADLPCVKSG